MTFNTGNPIGSADARDRLDNSENLDFAVNSLSPTFVDRIGVTRDTLEGIYQKSAYYRVGTFDAGYTLTNNRQTLVYGNIEYSWSGPFPKVVPAGSTPATSGGVGAGAWVDRTDVTLRSELTAGVISVRNELYSLRDLVSVKDFGAIGDGVTDDTSPIQMAINFAASLGKSVFCPAGTYKLTSISLPLQAGGIEIYGETYTSADHMKNGDYTGTTFVSSLPTGDVIYCNGGAGYRNRGVRIRNLNIKCVTSGYAISLVNSPEHNVLENLSVNNANTFGGSGILIDSCWVGTTVRNCAVSGVIGSSNIGIKIINTLKAGGIIIESSSITGFYNNLNINSNVYQATIRNVGMEQGVYGCYIEGNDPKVKLDTCHFEYNTDIAVYIAKSGGVTVTECTFYRNAESSSSVKAEIYIASGGLKYNYNTEITKNNFFGVGTGVTCVYVNGPSYGSGEIRNNSLTPYGSDVRGLYMGYGDIFNWTVLENLFGSATTPYNPTSGYKIFSEALSGMKGIRFSATPTLSSDPNTLDDYEEGSWTPVLCGDSGTLSQTYTIQTGRYQKIGRVVYFTFRAQLSSRGTVGAEAILSGLPFPVGGDRGFACGYISDFSNLGASYTMLTLRPQENTSKCYFRMASAASNGLSYGMSYTVFTDTTDITGGGYYTTTN